MTSTEIEISSENLYCDKELSILRWLKEIALQLAIANDLQIERNKNLERSVDLQETATETQWNQNRDLNDFIDYLKENK